MTHLRLLVATSLCALVLQLHGCATPAASTIAQVDHAAALPHLVVSSQEDLDRQVTSWIAQHYPSASVAVGKETFQLNRALIRAVPITLPTGERKLVQFTFEFVQP